MNKRIINLVSLMTFVLIVIYILSCSSPTIDIDEIKSQIKTDTGSTVDVEPIITLVGDTVLVTLNSVFNEPGFTATDSTDTGTIYLDAQVQKYFYKASDTTSVSETDFVNTEGTYLIKYLVTDADGHTAIAWRVVIVSSSIIEDTIPPVIVLGISSDTVIELYADFAIPSGTATDNIDGDISSKITKSGDFDNATVGVYKIIYKVSDKAGNSAIDTLTITVVDKTQPDTDPPVITISGGDTITITQGDVFNEPVVDVDVTAKDAIDGTVSVTKESSSDAVDVNTSGIYHIYYSATDKSANKSYDTLTVIVKEKAILDTIPPVISISGGNTVSINVNDNYTIPSASAVDNVDGAIADSAITKTGTVDNTKAGVYKIIYSATDKAGNTGYDTLTVTVVDNTVPDTVPPVITIPGGNVINIDKGSSFSEPSVTADDAVDGPVPVDKSGDTVDNNKVGTYHIYYSATDKAGNVAHDTLTVNVNDVVDTDPPEILLKGYDTVDVYLGNPYTDSGATASDAVDGDLTSSIKVDSGGLDVNTAGTYTLTFTVADVAGNADTVTRVVRVPSSLLVEDFENSPLDQIALKGIDDGSGYWYAYTDADNLKDSSHILPGADTVIDDKISDSATNSGSKGLYAKYVLNGGDYPYAALVMGLAGDGQYVDLSKVKNFEFWMKGSGKVRVNFTTKWITDTLATNDNLWGAIGKEVTLSSSWTKVTIPADNTNLTISKDSDLYNKKNWTDTGNSDHVTSIEFSVESSSATASNVTVELYLDDIKFNY